MVFSSQMSDSKGEGPDAIFSMGNLEESASSLKTSSAQRVNNSEESQHVSLAILCHPTIASSAEDSWKTLNILRWSKDKYGQHKKCYHLTSHVYLAPPSQKGEDCLKERECLLNQVKMHSLLCYSTWLSWNQTLLPLDHKIEAIWNENISCPLLASF